MREIADGLGSGVSQDQIRTSIEYGEQFLKEIKDRGKEAVKNNISTLLVQYNDLKIPMRIYIL